MATKDFIVKASDFDIRNYSYGKMKDNTFAPLTRYGPMLYRYQGTTNKAVLTFSSDVIVVTSYGFPKPWEGEDISTSYSKFKIPFDKEQKSCDDIYKMAKEIDEKHVNEKEEIFSEFIKDYNISAKKRGIKKLKIDDFKYSSIIKSPKKRVFVDDDDDEPIQVENQEPEKVYPDFFYVKLDKKFNTKKHPETGIDIKEEEISTLFFLKRENNTIEQLQIKSMSDVVSKIEPVFKWMSSIKLLVSMNLWSMKNVNKDGELLWGTKIKLRQIRIELAQSSIAKNVQKKINTTYALEDSDDDVDESDNKNISSNIKNSHNPNISDLLSDDDNKNNNDDDDDDDDNEDEEDEDDDNNEDDDESHESSKDITSDHNEHNNVVQSTNDKHIEEKTVGKKQVRKSKK